MSIGLCDIAAACRRKRQIQSRFVNLARNPGGKYIAASMTNSELIELAKAYVALSNSHRIDLIMPMFAAGALYASTAVGEHRGRATIGDMMHGFFTRYPDVHWHATNYRCTDHRVSFDFTMTANDATSGEGLERSGLEQFEFTADGSIKKITVDTA